MGVAARNDVFSVWSVADVVVILSEWPQYGEADLERVASILAEPFIVVAGGRGTAGPQRVLPSPSAAATGDA